MVSKRRQIEDNGFSDWPGKIRSRSNEKKPEKERSVNISCFLILFFISKLGSEVTFSWGETVGGMSQLFWLPIAVLQTTLKCRRLKNNYFIPSQFWVKNTDGDRQNSPVPCGTDWDSHSVALNWWSTGLGALRRSHLMYLPSTLCSLVTNLFLLSTPPPHTHTVWPGLLHSMLVSGQSSFLHGCYLPRWHVLNGESGRCRSPEAPVSEHSVIIEWLLLCSVG